MNKIEIKKSEEQQILEKFIITNVGKKWVQELGIVDYIKSESPDFIMKTKNDKTIAIELTKFIAKNKNLKYSQALTTVGNKICKIAKSKYNINIHMLIDKYDERLFSIHWKDHIDLAYNPGFLKVPKIKLFKQKLEELLHNSVEKLKKGELVQEWIQLEEEYYRVSMDPNACPWTNKYNCIVNNAGEITNNPINELEFCINKKNDKVNLYIKHCDQCYLLIFIPGSYSANFCSFDKNLFKHNFNSKFEKIFIYYENSDASYFLK